MIGPTEPAGVVVLGAGHAGAALAIALRQKAPDLPITLVGAEPDLPYHRPPLSKSFPLPPDLPEAQPLRPAAFYAGAGIDLRLGARATGIDRAARCLRLACGTVLPYRHLVLATGARPRSLPGPQPRGVLALRDIADARALAAALPQARRVAILGAGYIGMEAASALSERGLQVSVVERADRVLARVASPAVSAWVQARHEARGTCLRLGTGLAGIRTRDGAVAGLDLDDGTTLEADLLLLGIGALPEDGLARAAGLRTDDGVLVDAGCRSSDPAILAIGDCARFPCPVTSAPIRLESIQNAQDMARSLAARLAGDPGAVHRAVPWFWSDQGPDKLQSAGFFPPGCRTDVVGDPQAGRFSVLHSRDGVLWASESVNDPRTHMQTRRALAERLLPAAAEAAPAPTVPG